MKRFLYGAGFFMIFITGVVSCSNKNTTDLKVSFNKEMAFNGGDLSIDLNYGDVKVSEHGDNSIILKVDNDFENIQINESNGNIEIIEDHYERVHNSKGRKIEVFIPSSGIKKFKMSLDVSELSISGLSADEINITNGVGKSDISIDRVKNLEYLGGVDTSNIYIKNAENIKIESEVGDIDLVVDEFSNNLNIVSNIGNINLDIKDDDKIKLSQKKKIGSIKVKDYINTNGTKNIYVETNIGKVNIE